MEPIVFFLLSMEGLFLVTCAVILIYLIFRRIDIKKTENFEDRDN
ncbi:MAG: hypothetical protein O2796_02135 [Bacteroidetes bacterium]|nr:hypothetical protein [Bacteroidota bacterium]MDA0879178.1 hypothetical protein [Bacteroidota bacterium]MDA1115043.1 hypothetical protein [Bacteroidota bacterium]